MHFDSSYRRRAMQLWDEDQPEVRQELTDSTTVIGRTLQRFVALMKACLSVT